MNTIKTLGCIATNNYSRGKYDQAEPLFLDCIAKQKQHISLGENHVDTLVSITGLAVLYWG